MSPELRIIERTLDAIGRLLAQSGAARPPDAALSTYVRVISIAMGPVRLESELAAFDARAARPQPGGVRWILSKPQKSRLSTLASLRAKAARLVEALCDHAPGDLLERVASEGDPATRQLVEVARARRAEMHEHGPGLHGLRLPALLALLVFVISRPNGTR